MAGRLQLEECVSLETLEHVGTDAALDPIRLLGFRFFYASDAQAERIKNGNALRAADVTLCERRFSGIDAQMCACTSGVHESKEPPCEGEVYAAIHGNAMVALYSFDSKKGAYVSKCVFPVGVTRGEGL